MKYEVRMYHNAQPLNDNHLATFSVVFYFNDNALTIHNVKLMINKHGHKFISGPNYKNKEEQFKRHVFATRNLSQQIIASVLSEIDILRNEDHSILKEEPFAEPEEVESV